MGIWGIGGMKVAETLVFVGSAAHFAGSHAWACLGSMLHRSPLRRMPAFRTQTARQNVEFSLSLELPCGAVICGPNLGPYKPLKTKPEDHAKATCALAFVLREVLVTGCSRVSNMSVMIIVWA